MPISKEMKIKIKEQLKHILQVRNIKVAMLARETKVPAQTIHNWLQNKPPKNIDQLKKVSDYLGVTLDWLLYGVETELKNPLEAHQEEIVAGVWEVVLRRPKK